MLSEGAGAESIPNLEIEANDVKCSHASTVGPVDDDQRYYLATRGIPPEEADRLIVMGFFEDVIAKLPVRSLVEPLREAVTRKIEHRGHWRMADATTEVRVCAAGDVERRRRRSGSTSTVIGCAWCASATTGTWSATECSHEDYSLAEGEVWEDECEIECPKHGSTFSLTTGEPQTLPGHQAGAGLRGPGRR